MPQLRFLNFICLFTLAACANTLPESGRGSEESPDPGDPPVGFADAGRIGLADAGMDEEPAPAPAEPTEPSEPAEPPPTAALRCEYRSTAFAGALVELDAGPTSTERLAFVVRDLPDPGLIDAATLRFDTYDADHPGQEGRIFVNGMGPFDLPANPAWDNADGTGTLDVHAALVPGDNLVEFAPGPLIRSFFRVGHVAIDAEARVAECTPAPPPADPAAVEREVGYRDATYTNRRTWVIRCADYAFTAYGDEHLATDCDGGYRPGGDRRGTATFAFPGVARAEYEVWIRSRHTENRSATGALFVVNGVGRRISQRSDRGYTDDLWGTALLAGDVDVVLDSSGESQSDSVISVRLVPVR